MLKPVRERKPPAKLGYDALREYAMRALAQRALSAGELRQRLLRRAEVLNNVDLLIEDFRANGYLNDERLASSFATSRLDNQGFGKMRVVRDLRARRVAGSVAERAAAEVYREVDENALIDQYLRRKYRSANLAEELKDPRKLASAYRRLRLAGFRSGPAIQALKRYAAEAEQLEGMPEEDQEPPDDRGLS
jgi:regulatory protein